jgi:hypothetical protein
VSGQKRYATAKLDGPKAIMTDDRHSEKAKREFSSPVNSPQWEMSGGRRSWEYSGVFKCDVTHSASVPIASYKISMFFRYTKEPVTTKSFYQLNLLKHLILV